MALFVQHEVGGRRRDLRGVLSDLSLLIFSGLLTIIAIDHPFAGTVKVGPEAIAGVLEDFGRRPSAP